MKRQLLWLVIGAVFVVLAGCGGSTEDRVLVQKVIASDPLFDAEIVDPAGPALPVVSQVQRDNLLGVRAGVNAATNDVYRAFLSFPLTTIPVNARIQSATLSIVIKSFTALPPVVSVPIRIELVSYTPPLTGNDFSQFLLPPISHVLILPPITSADVNHEVNVDVTPLMVEAQIRSLPNFQLRILQDNDLLTVAPGIVEIDEETVANEPQLIVDYF